MLINVDTNQTGIGRVPLATLLPLAAKCGFDSVAFPLWVLLRYEFGLAVFGLFALYRAIREGGFFERVLAGWFLGGLMWSVGYAGAGAGHALWLVVPLAALVALSAVSAVSAWSLWKA